MTLGRAIAVTALVLCAMTCPQASTCQEGYTRHHVEMICTSQHNCSFHFSRDLLFNDITRTICIDILQANNSLGIIQVERLPTELHCSERTLFFTRETKTEIFSATRCAQMGSCVNNTCSRIQYNSEIAELSNASNFPGYSGCELSCGGLMCGCLLPLPACSFYRIAHVPVNDVVYKISRCMEWKPRIQLKVKMSLNNQIVDTTLRLVPYLSHRIQDVSFNVVSVAKPNCPLLSSTFALAHNEGLIIPEEVQLPVSCQTPKQAATNFRSCTNRMICDCDTEVSPARCNCPQDSITTVRTVASSTSLSLRLL